jgi:hypothetical protein
MQAIRGIAEARYGASLSTGILHCINALDAKWFVPAARKVRSPVAAAQKDAI